MKRLFSPLRLAAIMALMVLVFAIYLVALYDMQVVNGDRWSTYAENHRLVGRRIEATRGRILDRNELDLVSNRAVHNIVLDFVALQNSGANVNEVLLHLANLTESLGYAHVDTLAISAPPFEFTEMNATQRHHLNSYIAQHERGIRNLIETMRDTPLELDEETDEIPEETPEPETLSIDNVSAVQLMAFMRGRYNISPEYSAEETRRIAGIRFELDMRHVIGMAEYVFVEDAQGTLISAVLEHSFPGVVVQESSVRRYNTTAASHILGRVGMLTAEDLELELFADYPLDAQVGRDGLERDFEPFLHGSNGWVRQTVTSAGVVVGERVTVRPEPGGNVITTLDSGLQAVTEATLRSTIRQINTGRAEGMESLAGSAVAIHVETGEVLAIASYPGFSLENFSAQFTALENDPGLPFLNRATAGVYSPGSAFKMVTAAAALYHGLISEHTEIYCARVFRLFEDTGYLPTCMGHHGSINLRQAIAYSCNIYFYQLMSPGWLTIGQVEEFAERFGLGTLTGIGFGEQAGQRSSWDNMLALNRALGSEYDTVFDGQIIQIGIGQGVSLFTPLQLANYTAMIANGGVRYRPQLLREVRSYDNSHVIHAQEPEVLADFSEVFAPFIRSIQEGMLMTTTHGTAAAQLAGFHVPVASKTGTVEIRGQDSAGPYEHGVFVAYAPMESPQIAIAVVIENGGSGSAVIPVARGMLEYFFQNDAVNQRTPRENVLLF